MWTGTIRPRRFCSSDSIQRFSDLPPLNLMLGSSLTTIPQPSYQRTQISRFYLTTSEPPLTEPIPVRFPVQWNPAVQRLPTPIANLIQPMHSRWETGCSQR